MNDYKLIRAGREHLYNAKVNLDAGNHEQYCRHMQLCLDLLIEELVGGPPAAQATPSEPFNPEKVLDEIANAIKHRTISTTQRWKIIYYHTRLTCVPTTFDVPNKIVLHEFTENMVNKGFSVTYWNQLKTNVIKLHEELVS